MKKSGLIQNKLEEVATIQRLTSVLESVSSIRISQIKDKVLPGRECFDDLWQVYTELRADKGHNRFSENHQLSNGKTVYIIVASEGSLSGPINQKIADYFLSARETRDADIVVLGGRATPLLEQRGLSVTQTFPLPDVTNQIDVEGICRFIEPYAKITAYYQSYVSLSQQEVKTLDLINAVATLGEAVKPGQEVISSHDYVFEPSLKEIVSILEAGMLQVALREIILDSHLAQLASRFVAMLAAEEKAKKSHRTLNTAWLRAKREERDRQLRENSTVGEAV